MVYGTQAPILTPTTGSDMFLSFNMVGYSGGYFKCKIIDTDFVETVEVCSSAWDAVIQVYEHRGLDVVRNLALAMIYHRGHGGTKITIRDMIDHAIRKTPGIYIPYRNDVEAYLAKIGTLM
jgi:hypothetical protein